MKGWRWGIILLRSWMFGSGLAVWP
jgi:hypothetical protein